MKNFQYAQGISWTKMDESVIIFDPRVSSQDTSDKRAYHELNPIASFLWEKLPDNQVEELPFLLTKNYEVSLEVAKNDVNEFIQNLKSARLIQ